MPSYLNSVILVDKPIGQTSADTINELKRIVEIKKIGHSGTLDKFASGLLIVCTGWATKLTRYFLESDKRYICDIKLGIVTDTGDSDGIITDRRDVSNLTSETIPGILSKFTGEIDQMPPYYSALKIGGKRASDLKREGKNITLKERKVNIRKLDILKIDSGSARITLDVTCSKGTYIRSLARDIGEHLGTGAYLENLRRVASGNFSVQNAAAPDEIKKNKNGLDTGKKFLLKPEEALSDFSKIKIKNNIRKNIFNGVFFKKNDAININFTGNNPFIILDEDENLIAIANVDIDNWLIKYLNVFNAQDQDKVSNT